jgi:hypothetical protein
VAQRLLFDWDPAKAAANASKHGVTFEQAMGVFDDPLALSVLDPAAPTGEERWVTIGLASGVGLVLVVHTHIELDEETLAIRMISARAPTRKERTRYENEPY